VTDVTLLQAVRLKGGMADAELLAAATGAAPGALVPELEALTAAGLVAEMRGRHRITPEGRTILDQALDAEREGLDARVLEGLYERFVPLNATFKQLISDWQLRDGQPNDHTDGVYDAAVLERLTALHADASALCDDLGATVPRLSPYGGRLTAALEKVRGGDGRYMASPVVDSYHQVWFELHEELIGAAGLDREAEAAAGRAE
jgi:hypothetical protein